jgi:hypothetical protein
MEWLHGHRTRKNRRKEGNIPKDEFDEEEYGTREVGRRLKR